MVVLEREGEGLMLHQLLSDIETFVSFQVARLYNLMRNHGRFYHLSLPLMDQHHKMFVREMTDHDFHFRSGFHVLPYVFC